MTWVKCLGILKMFNNPKEGRKVDTGLRKQKEQTERNRRKKIKIL